jgi:hypothetical protein
LAKKINDLLGVLFKPIPEAGLRVKLVAAVVEGKDFAITVTDTDATTILTINFKISN